MEASLGGKSHFLSILESHWFGSKGPGSGIQHAELQVSSFFFEKPLIPNSGSLLF